MFDAIIIDVIATYAAFMLLADMPMMMLAAFRDAKIRHLPIYAIRFSPFRFSPLY